MSARAPLRPATAGTLIAILAVAVLAVDQLSKFLATAFLPPEQLVPVLGDFFGLYLIRNSGAAFSLGAGFTWVFTIALAAVAVVIVAMGRRVRSRAWAITLGLLLGGVLGNLGDRLFREPGFGVGHVVDFVYTPWMWFWTTPAIYNVADCFIVCDMIAVALLVVLGIHLDGTREQRRHAADSDETILGVDGDAPVGATVAGFGDQFPVADPDAGIPDSERGLPPLSTAEQEQTAREADREARDHPLDR